MEIINNKTGILTAECYQNIIEFSDQPRKVTCINTGNVFELNDNKFVLTCYHCIKNSHNNKLLMSENKSYSSSIISTSPELELGLLQLDNINHFAYNINDFITSPLENSQIFTIETYDIDEYIKSKRCIPLNIDCTFHDIIQSSHLSLNIPKMPFIRVILNRKYNDISQLSGISGSIVKSHDKIIGIVSSIIEKYVYIIPSHTIIRFLTEFISTNNFKGITPLTIQYKTCIFDNNELPSKAIYGILVTNTYGIKNALLKNDIIIEINHIQLNVNNINNMDFNTYIILNFKSGENIPLKIARLKKKSTHEYNEKDIIIQARSLDSIKYIPMEFNNKVYEFSHMIFIELSEDIINYYVDLGIFTGQSVKDKYIDTPYHNSESKIIIMININKTQLLPKIKKIVTDIGLPIVPIKNKQCSFTIVKKINGNVIDNLEDLIKYINNDSTVINMNIDGYGKLNINIKDQNIISIIKAK